MRARIYLKPDPNSAKGFYLTIVSHDDEWSLNYYNKQEEFVKLQDVDIQMPSEKKMVEIGLMKVDQMKAELTEHINECTAKIKEYESRFLALAAPLQEDNEPPDIDGFSDWSREGEDMDDPERHPI